MFVKEIKNPSYFTTKTNFVFFTNNQQLFLEILKNIDIDEFEQYGSKDGQSIIPVKEISPSFKDCNNNNVYLIPSNTEKFVGYCGKFEVDITELTKRCDEQGVVFFLYQSEEF